MDEIKKVYYPNQRLRYHRLLLGLSQRRLAEQIGTTEDKVSRWERGERKPNPYYREKLCKIFNKNAQELGFIQQEPSIVKTTSSELAFETQPILSLGDDIMSTQDTQNNLLTRRQTLQAMVGATGALFTSTCDTLDHDVLDRLLKALKKPSYMDEIAISHLESIAQIHWQQYASSNSSLAYRRDMLPSILGHLQTITHALEQSHLTPIHNRLVSLAAESTELIGAIYFDLKDNENATLYYDTAVEAAKEAHNDVLYAIVLGRKSFIPIYTNNARNALPDLQEAQAKAINCSSDKVLAWLQAVQAEAHANIGDTDSCLQALDKAEELLCRARVGTTSYSFAEGHTHFSHSVLLGYRGVCNMRLRRSQIALSALETALEAKANDIRISTHKGIVLTDLAATYMQLHEMEAACVYAQQALAVVQITGSARVLKRVLDFRNELTTWQTTPYVKELDISINASYPAIVEKKA